MGSTCFVLHVFISWMGRLYLFYYRFTEPKTIILVFWLLCPIHYSNNIGLYTFLFNRLKFQRKERKKENREVNICVENTCLRSDMILVGNEHLKFQMQDKNIPINIVESRQRQSKLCTNHVKTLLRTHSHIHTYTVQSIWTTLMALFNKQQKQQQQQR